jgi:hypothetical protein
MSNVKNAASPVVKTVSSIPTFAGGGSQSIGQVAVDVSTGETQAVPLDVVTPQGVHLLNPA